MAQRLKAKTALAEELSSISSTRGRELTNTYNSRSGVLMPPGHSWAHTHTHAHVYTYGGHFVLANPWNVICLYHTPPLKAQGAMWEGRGKQSVQVKAGG